MRLSLLALALPIFLIHGYSEDSQVWNSWKGWLSHDGFSFEIPTSKADQCGNVGDKAAELNKTIGNREVNIVAHSQGGLVARWFVAHYPNHVKNLVLIATPNLGTPAAWMDLTNCPFIANSSVSALEDLLPNSTATLSPDSPNTKYYAIAGNYSNPCVIVIQRSLCYLSDGFVPVSSALSHYPVLRVYPLNHTGLLNDRSIYATILPIFTLGPKDRR